MGVLCALVAVTQAHAKILVVDDDNVPCFGANFPNINGALAVAEENDEIWVCPGQYPEQVVLTKTLTLRGRPVGSQKAVIQPTALPATRPSVTGGKLVAAGIIVDAPYAVIDTLIVDMTAANATGCAPTVAGIYFRNASGLLNNVEEFGAQPVTPIDCDTGVGVLVEGGQAGDIFGLPLFGKASVAAMGSQFHDNTKGGMVFLGFRAMARILGTEIIGQGVTAAVQNDLQFGMGAKGRLQEVALRDARTTTSGKTATGLLLFGSGKVRTRRSTITDVQTGVFVVGNKIRVLDTEIGDVDDGVVLLGQKNRVSRALLDVASVSGVFIDGDLNLIRGGNMTDMPIGVWFYDGNRNVAQGIDFTNVLERERVGGTRNLTADSVDPFTLDCSIAADCDDGNPCTTDACNALSGACSYTNLADLTSCADGTLCNGSEFCVAGVCHLGTPLVCTDGDPCTNNVCDPALGCQFPPYPDLTPCPDSDACNGTEVCMAGSCTPGLALVCDDANPCTLDACDSVLGCQAPPLPDATPCPDATVCNGDEACSAGICTTVSPPLVCDDLNECTTEFCDPVLGCQPPTPVPDMTPCTGGLCTGGTCL